MPTLAPMIAGARVRRALKVSDLAALCGVTRFTVSRWEAGYKLPQAAMIVVYDAVGHAHPGPLALALEVPWQELAEARAYDFDTRHIERRRRRLLGEGGLPSIAVAAISVLGSPPGYVHGGITPGEGRVGTGSGRDGGHCALRHVRAQPRRQRRGRKIVFARRANATGPPFPDEVTL
jgi:hypothetical protein